jgi:ABC-type transport system involved in multi-copper enzyme maturation permease subunit
MKIRAIALNTFKEAVRNKIFYLLIFFGIFFSLSSKLVSLLTIGDSIKILKDIGLASINFFSVLIAIFTGINLVYKEIEKKTIFFILSKPVERRQFILGKFFGLAITIFVALFIMTTVFSVFILIFSGTFDPNIILYFVFLFTELLIIISISILFSSFSTPILSSIFTIILYLIGHVIWTFNEFKYKLINPLEKYIAYLIYYLFPNLEKFNVKSTLVMGDPIPLKIIASTLSYGFLYITAILLLSIHIFNRREF